MPLGLEFFLRTIPRRARNGLFGGRQVGGGNIVSDTSNSKTKRWWRPNVVEAHLYSEVLDRKLKIKVATTVLRDIDKAGGLDSYLLRTPDRKLFSDVGSTLKYHIGLIYKHRQRTEFLRAHPELVGARLAALEALADVDHAHNSVYATDQAGHSESRSTTMQAAGTGDAHAELVGTSNSTIAKHTTGNEVGRPDQTPRYRSGINRQLGSDILCSPKT